MKKKTKKIIKIILIPIIVFILGNIGIYVYCFLTPKMEINKSQSYYLYDNEKPHYTGLLNLDEKCGETYRNCEKSTTSCG